MIADRARMLIPTLVMLGGMAVLLALGTWQFERKAWKEALIGTLTQRLAAPPQPLPPPQAWGQLDRAAAEFRRVTFRAEFLPGKTPRDREARLYTSGSALRDDVKTPGYFVFAPARLPGGQVVVVNRGYVANPQPNAGTAPAPLPDGPVEVVGVLRWPEPPGWFVSTHSSRDDLWLVRDHVSMAAQKQWGAVAPFTIEQEAPAPAGGVPAPGRLKVNLPNHHLQYALTWYGLALVLAAVFAIWALGRRRTQPPR